MDEKIYYPDLTNSKSFKIDKNKYKEMYQESISNPEEFWRKMGNRIDWITPFSKVKDTSFSHDDVSIKWYEDGSLNVSYNCIDRHLEKNRDKVAIIWESDEPSLSKNITYGELYKQVCRLSNIYKELGVNKGDRVILYMPMIPEAAYAMLACARIGAVHSVVFGGFSPEALASRITDCGASLVVTADEGPRGGKSVPLKENVNKALEISGDIKTLVVKRTGANIYMKENRDFSYNEMVDLVSETNEPEEMSAEDPLFILYTSGSTGKPKGVQHSNGGYIVYASLTHEYIFDYHQEDIYWCTADVGWITGHSYIVYGPLSNGATTLMFEGVPTYPDCSRFWQVCEKHNVSQFYTAPTAIRALMGQGDDFVNNCDLSSLRILGTVGEPINPEAWEWYNKVVGKGKCPIVDTWWQTETGGILITPLPGATATKPGSATTPFFGIKPVIIDPKTGQELIGNNVEGVLAFKDSWPSQMRTVYGDHDRFIKTYFSDFKGYYFSGDGCKRDKDGYYWITGRVDDVLNVSGHRMGTAEIESALVSHPLVSESAVVGYPHKIKGQGIYAFVTLMVGKNSTPELTQELEAWVRKEIGPIAKPDYIQWSPNLPKTRSGKILRSTISKILNGEKYTTPATIEDINTLEFIKDIHNSIKS